MGAPPLFAVVGDGFGRDALSPSLPHRDEVTALDLAGYRVVRVGEDLGNLAFRQETHPRAHLLEGGAGSRP